MTKLLWLAFALLWLTAQAALADSVDDETRRIAKRLQCPVCESVTVADSPAELAGQMRSVIRRKLEQGDSEDQIIAYFVERYGDGVLAEPPRRGLSLAVWAGPLVVLLAGAGLLAVLVRAWLRPDRLELPRDPAAQSTAPSPNGTQEAPGPGIEPSAYVDRARQELEGFRRDA
ncbi:MAG TPA: cytochrome c-type biogenesis protein [Chloroflexota bacterium]|nr:cytochrome c-type biogenesis protein [Chloroflexota bacterium]